MHARETWTQETREKVVEMRKVKHTLRCHRQLER